MLKFLFCILIFALIVRGELDYVRAPQSEITKLIETSLYCITETKADADTLQKIITWSFKNSSKVREYLFCFLNRAGYADDEGRLLKNNILPHVGHHKKKDEFEKVLDECNKLDGKDKLDRMFKISVCVHDKSPIMFTL